MEIKSRVLKNQYHDSVALMFTARQLKDHPDVEDAALIMGTEVNKELLEQGGLLTKEGKSAQANDLIIAVKCEGKAEGFLDEAESLLVTKTKDKTSGAGLLLSVRSAAREHADLNLAVISVGGSYAAREAREALTAGMHVLLFSDNVSLEDEIALKKYALQQDLLLMGPGAGTAIINGVGLGFANAVPRGKIGMVSAAGTGLQEVSTLLARQGQGISQAIGTGGRDLSKAVGGLTFFAGIQALQADPQTGILVLVSKPPDEQVTQELIKKIQASSKPTILCLLGADLPEKSSSNLHFTRTLEECALTAAALAQNKKFNAAKAIGEQDKDLKAHVKNWKAKFDKKQRYIRALFSGGTLCYEAQVIWKDLLPEPVLSNAPLDKKNLMADSHHSQGHCAVDLGEEEFTRGRPHPMIDNELRIQRMQTEVADKETAVILLDVVIGYGAHPDPAAELGQAIKRIKKDLKADKRSIAFVASVTGTKDDPQGLAHTVKALEKAGVMICASNAQAARLAAALASKKGK